MLLLCRMVRLGGFFVVVWVGWLFSLVQFLFLVCIAGHFGAFTRVLGENQIR